MKIPLGKPRGIFVGEEIYYTLPRASGFLGIDVSLSIKQEQ